MLRLCLPADLSWYQKAFPPPAWLAESAQKGIFVSRILNFDIMECGGKARNFPGEFVLGLDFALGREDTPGLVCDFGNRYRSHYTILSHRSTMSGSPAKSRLNTTNGRYCCSFNPYDIWSSSGSFVLQLLDVKQIQQTCPMKFPRTESLVRQRR